MTQFKAATYFSWRKRLGADVAITKAASRLKKPPLVSIVTPSFNQGEFIEETILSVKNQSHPNIEHIIVDGGSTDNTLDILKKYEGTYNMNWISEPDRGHSDAVNKGFGMARGEIIGWLNSDDVYFEKTTVQSVVNAFLERPEVDVMYGDIVFVSQDSRILMVRCVPNFSYKRLLRSCFLEQPAVFMKKRVVEDNKLELGLFALDYEYWLRIGKEYRFHHLPRILAADRNHPGRISISQRAQLLTQSDQIRPRYGQTHGLRDTLAGYVDKLTSGMPRRLKGLALLLSLTRKRDLAFDAKVSIDLNTIKCQLFARSLEDISSSEKQG